MSFISAAAAQLYDTQALIIYADGSTHMKSVSPTMHTHNQPKHGCAWL